MPDSPQHTQSSAAGGSTDVAAERADWLAPGVFVVFAAELLAIGLSVGGYVVFRVTSPEFQREAVASPHWGWGAAQLFVLVLAWCAALTGLARVRRHGYAQAMAAAALAIMFTLVVIGLKAQEWASWREPMVIVIDPPKAPTTAALSAGAVAVADVGDAKAGVQAFTASCAACHGPHGEGVPNIGPPLAKAKFVLESSDAQLQNLIIAGRQPGDPGSLTGKAMPARGGNPFLGDADVTNIVAYLRSLSDGGAVVGGDALAATVALAPPRWVVPAAAPPPGGLAASMLPAPPTPALPPEIQAQQASPQERAIQWWVVALSGVHTLHLLVGVAVLANLLWQAFLGAASDRGEAAASLASAHTAIAVVVWLLMLPLLYVL